jgi:aspartyl/asparaginyl beta-hydroxylase (cupin superfamily)
MERASKHELATWLPRIHAANEQFRSELGRVKFNALGLACNLLAAPRVARKSLLSRAGSTAARPSLQCPWLPYWPALEAKPLHRANDYSWTKALRQATNDIRSELACVSDGFGRAHYDSDLNEKPWHAYYFFLHGRPNAAHLAACPRTREALEEVPHNSLHVCFSALEPGASLHPHTGPTNASLTAHLGLVNCARTSLWVAGQEAQYRESEILIFDDSFIHWVDNAGTERRYTLMITFWHPELNALERQLLHRAVRTVKG